MIYAEAAYFDGYAVAHCAAREDHQRLERKKRLAREHRNRHHEKMPFLRNSDQRRDVGNHRLDHLDSCTMTPAQMARDILCCAAVCGVVFLFALVTP